MSSGYSSLEEDAEDFFFTARTSFFRRAPPPKPRAGQGVSECRGRARGWGIPGLANCVPDGRREGRRTPDRSRRA